MDRATCTHTPSYCEENVHKLIATLVAAGADIDSLYAVFISNLNKTVRARLVAPGPHATAAPTQLNTTPPALHHCRCPSGASARRAARTAS
jgi:hypothetical protein